MAWGDRLAWCIGSGFGSGFFPIAPGTAGSAAALVLFLVELLLGSGIGGIVLLAMAGAGFGVGVWATGRMSTPENPDPGTAVWDEFVGMWLTLLPLTLPWVTAQGMGVKLLLAAIALVAFRAMDILKPWPCRRLERLPGGWGIMLDDVGAGIWAALLLTALWQAGQLIRAL